MKKIAMAIVIVLAMFLAVPGWAGEKTPELTPEQQLIVQVLKFKQLYGRELIVTATLGFTIIKFEGEAKAFQEEIKKLKAEIKQMKKKKVAPGTHEAR